MSGQEFNQNPSEAKRAAEGGPVIVTDCGEPAFVLLTYNTYRRLSGEGDRSLVDLLGQDDGGFDFVAPRLGDDLARPAGLDDVPASA